MAAVKSKKHIISWPLNSGQVMNIDDMFDDLYKRLKFAVFTASDGGSFLNGDLLVHNGATVEGLPDVVTGNALISGGVEEMPSWGKIDLTTHVTGILPVTNGGSGTGTAFTQGSVIFAGASGIYAQDNSNFFWDDSNNRLGIGTATPALPLHVLGNAAFGASAAATYSDVSSTTVTAVQSAAGTISLSGASDRVVGLYSKFTASNTAPARSFRGYLIVSNSSGTMGSAALYTGTLEITGTSNVTEANLIGAGFIINNASATLVTARGIDIQNATITAGAITNQAGIRINALSGATNNVHLLIGQSSVPTGTFGIYNASTADSYFAGEVGFGTTTPTAPVHVSKTFSVASAAGIRVTALHDTAGVGQFYSMQVIGGATHSTGTLNALENMNLTGEYRGTSATNPAVTSLYGALIRLGINNPPGGGTTTGTITTGYSLRLAPLINQATTPTVTFTNLFGCVIDTPPHGTNGLTVTNAGGLAIVDQLAGTRTTNLLIGTSTIPTGTWSIHNVSTRNNYSAGPIQMGHTTTWGSGTNFISFADGTVPGTPASNTAAIFADDVDGTVELFGINEAGDVTQLTGAGGAGEHPSWSVLTNGDPDAPELIFADGEVIMLEIS